MRRDDAEYRIGTKSDSYIFAIEKNSIPISLKGGGDDDYLTIEKCDNQQLLIIPTKKLITPDEIEFYRANWRRFRFSQSIIFINFKKLKMVFIFCVLVLMDFICNFCRDVDRITSKMHNFYSRMVEGFRYL